jgi:hypothetical protein
MNYQPLSLKSEHDPRLIVSTIITSILLIGLILILIFFYAVLSRDNDDLIILYRKNIFLFLLYETIAIGSFIVYFISSLRSIVFYLSVIAKSSITQMENNNSPSNSTEKSDLQGSSESPR